MRFLQVGDIHIGESRFLPEYVLRHRDVLSQIHTLAKQVGMCIITGDLFHHKKVTTEERHLADWFLSEFEIQKIPTIMISGNHDLVHDQLTLLDGYSYYPWNFLKITTKPARFEGTPLPIICLPYANHTKESVEQAVLDLCKTPKEKVVVVLHECCLDARFDNGFLATKGLILPDLRNVVYWAVGDIHVFQTATHPNSFYSGTPLQFGFADAEKKGVLIVDTDYPCDPQFVPLIFKPFKVVKSIKEIDDEAYYKIIADESSILKANQDPRVIQSEWDSGQEKVDFDALSITDGLTDFLKNLGLEQDLVTDAHQWVEKVCNGSK